MLTLILLMYIIHVCYMNSGDEGVVYLFDSNNMHGDVTNDCSRSFIKPCPIEKVCIALYGGSLCS